jgi:hypothetical protein
MKKALVLSMIVVVLAFFMMGCVSKKQVDSIENYSKKSVELNTKLVDDVAAVKSKVDANNKVLVEGFKNLNVKGDNIAKAIEELKNITKGNVEIYGTVANCSVLTVREQGTVDSKAVKYLKKGDVVKVVTVDNGWAHLADGGFVAVKYLQFNYKITL